MDNPIDFIKGYRNRQALELTRPNTKGYLAIKRGEVEGIDFALDVIDTVTNPIQEVTAYRDRLKAFRPNSISPATITGAIIGANFTLDVLKCGGM